MRAIKSMYKRVQSFDLFIGTNTYIDLKVEDCTIILRTANLEERFDVPDSYKRRKYFNKIMEAYLKSQDLTFFEESVKVIRRELKREQNGFVFVSVMSPLLTVIATLLFLAQ